MASFAYIDSNIDKLYRLDSDFLSQVIYTAVKLKAMVVMNDETEQNFRMILNFGHSIGHGLEKLSDYSLAHGVAVGLGMLVEARVAFILGELDINSLQQISQLLLYLIDDLTPLTANSPASIINAMRNDKKNQQGKIKIVLLNKIGAVKNINQQVAFEVDDAIIEQAILDISTLSLV